MNKQQIQEIVYSISEVYRCRSFTSAIFLTILKECGFNSKERSLIIRRLLMWGYLVKSSSDPNPNYIVVDIDKAVRTRTLHHGRHGKRKNEVKAKK